MRYIAYIVAFVLLVLTGVVKAEQKTHPQIAGFAINNCVLMGEYAEDLQKLRQKHSTLTLQIVKEINAGEELNKNKRDSQNMTASYVFTFARSTDPTMISNYVVANCIRGANEVVNGRK